MELLLLWRRDEVSALQARLGVLTEYLRREQGPGGTHRHPES